MNKPYILECRKIAKAQSEDRRDFVDVLEGQGQVLNDFTEITRAGVAVDNASVIKRSGLKIHQKLSKYNQSPRYGEDEKYLTIHYVGAISSAKNNCIYFSKGNRNASAHLFCDKEIWQSIPLNKAAWHCGGGLQDTGSKMVEGNKGASLHGTCRNANSIGIELCCTKDSKGRIVPSEEAIETAIPLVQWLMEEYNIPASRVVRHFDVTGKHCPNGYISKTEWEKLHKRLTGGKTSSVKNTTAKKTTVKKTKPAIPTSNIAKGSTGEQVKKLQRCLNYIMNSGLSVDGSFGPSTDKALRAFQKKYKLTVDGSCGPKTRAKLKEVIA